MKGSAKINRDALLRFWARHRRNGLAQKCVGDEPPLRSELFSSDQMNQHGRVLAGSHRLDLRRAPDRLLTRLTENEGVLIETCNLLTAAVQANPCQLQTVTKAPAATVYPLPPLLPPV